ncbi:hypothetical protein MFU01_18670 [Myxococcus fulvus]|uniref:Uncharacterized protein n=1 Tax=Myxococcus fulvus TaxID=33 RepID=A0A511SY45_MYXFU|nr:hypothetical protein MFU01_18670 [Myxococcus fulvus]
MRDQGTRPLPEGNPARASKRASEQTSHTVLLAPTSMETLRVRRGLHATRAAVVADCRVRDSAGLGGVADGL